MSYLLDKKEKRKKFSQIMLGVVFLVVLFYFRLSVWSGFSYIGQIIFHPVLVVGNKFEEKFKNIGSYFVSKSSLYNQNQKLQGEVAFDDARMANYDSLVLDDANLKEILGRKDVKAIMTVAVILARPNQSPYDTLLIDVGLAEGIKTGETVFALGEVPIGSISNVYPNSAKVVLFSSPGEMTQAMITNGNISVEIIGRGGGNFEMIMPKDFTLPEGTQVVLPGINSYVLAIVQKIISDPRNPSVKALLVSPVNIQSLKFVEVEQ
jgi:cell shape-determining protein MreC